VLVTLAAASPSPAGGVSLETLRQKVRANEAKASLLRMEFECRTEFAGDDPTTPESIKKAIREKRGGHGRSTYAQDGHRYHKTSSTYEGAECVHAEIEVVDGKVRKRGRLPDLMEGWITREDKFTWTDVEPIRFGFRPYDGRLLSACLVPACACLREERVTVGDREAVCVEIQERDKPVHPLLLWIDLERGLPLRSESHYRSDSVESRTVVESTRFHQLPNGGWMPAEGIVKMHRIREGFIFDLTLRYIVDVNSISIEKKDIPDSLFDIQFPPGARIQDATGGSP